MTHKRSMKRDFVDADEDSVIARGERETRCGVEPHRDFLGWTTDVIS